MTPPPPTPNPTPKADSGAGALPEYNFTGYQIGQNYHWVKIWHFALGPGPIPLAKGPLTATFTVRAPKGVPIKQRTAHMKRLIKRVFKLKLP